MTYSEAIEYLYSLRWFGTKFGLENTLRLLKLAGDPHQRLRFIHVAGTNGKGSTCAMLESIYRRAGLKVGLFTSPHLVAFGERIQVNRQPLSEAETVALLQELLPLIARFSKDEHPTFFEVVVVMGLLHFLRHSCELVILETGLGGRLDATNVVIPLASVITNIQYDHQKWLGQSLKSIAAEKSGIIKPRVPAITGTQAAEPLAVIRAAADLNQAVLVQVTPERLHQPPLNQMRLPLLGEHQRLNAAVAVATAQVLDPILPVSDTAMLEGLSQVYWPGRLQVLPQPCGRKIVLDGAHNEGGAQVLAATLQAHFPGERCSLILGILRDKDWERMCQLLAPLARQIILVPVASERTAEPHGLAEVCQRINPAAAVLEANSLAQGFALTAADPFVTVTGSLYLVGEAMEILHVSAEKTSSERHLNEWAAEPGTMLSP